MIDTQQMQDCSIQVMNVNRIFAEVLTEIIRFGVRHSWCDTTTCHPGRKTTWVVIPPAVFFTQISLAIHRPSKLTSPDYQRIV